MKLTLTHIQHYPIGGENALKVIDENKFIAEIVGIITTDPFLEIDWDTAPDDVILRVMYQDHENKPDYDFAKWGISQIKPLLRPMSDLYKEIDGKIGIVDIFKMTNIRIESYSVTKSSLAYDDGAEYCGFCWEDDNKCFSNSDDEMFFTMEMMEYLFANHYDVYGLIDQNLALPKTI